MKKVTFILIAALACAGTAQAQKQFTLESPDDKLATHITVGDKLTYDITIGGRQILAASPLSIILTM